MGHVPSEENPADIMTRRATVLKLASMELWWHGPCFLKEDESLWPGTEAKCQKMSNDDQKSNQAIERITTKPKKSNEHNKTYQRVMMSVKSSSDPSWRLQPTLFSSWRRLIRVYAWVNRFIMNSRSPVYERQSGELSTDEIKDAENAIIIQAQNEAFTLEIKALRCSEELPKSSKLLSLLPRLHEDGLERSNGRLQYAEFLPFDVRYPIILPRKHWVTKLIVKSYHEQTNHAGGTNQTLTAISSQFWIIAGREEVRDWEKECAECRRRNAKAAKQIMAPLPSIRVKTSMRAFRYAAVDYAGPFLTTQGRGKYQQKRYLCLFTCLSCRAVHLEMAFSMDTDSFLNAFFRMANRRGLPEEIISDNGTNFVGAEKELRELVNRFDENRIMASTANKGVKWHFNPPYAPHFGGVFETTVKSVKKAIRAILGSADITDEELLSALTGAEALINSRSLTYQSANPKDSIPLTPNHFLHGQVGGKFAPDSVDETEFNPRKRWRRVQELVRHFWHRWLSEWIPTLSQRKKWQQSQKDIKEGEIALVISPDSPRGHWPLGKIVSIHPGKDGHTRVVKVQIGKTIVTRPITKICPLECNAK